MFKKNNNAYFYEIFPEYFYDSNQTGFGDYQGVEKKINYFINTKINNLIFPNILFNYEKYEDLEQIHSLYGSIKDFVNLINNLKKNNINSYVKIDIARISDLAFLVKRTKKLYEEEKIDNSHKNLDSFAKTSSFYLQNTSTFEYYKDKKIDDFYQIINFFKNIGINCFYLQNINDKANSFDNSPLENKHFLLLKTCVDYLKKEIKDLSLIIEVKKSLKIGDLFAKYDIHYDYIFTYEKTFLADDKFYPREKKGKLDIETLYLLKKEEINNSKIISSINNVAYGKTLTIWGNSEVFREELAKSMILFQIFGKNKFSIFQGEELGLQNFNFIHQQQFNDPLYNQRKRFLETKKISSEDFFDARSIFSPLNNQLFFPWDNSWNYGFSKFNQALNNFSKNAEQNNLNSEIHNKKSVFNFYMKMLYFHKKNEFSNQKFSISLIKNKKIIKIYNKKWNNKFFAYINLNSQPISLSIDNSKQVLFSSYENKTYINKIKELAPFESIIMTKKK